MTLCPCSKSISKYSAHSQRGKVTIKVRFKKFIWLEELIEIAETSASSPVYSLLKDQMKSLLQNMPMRIPNL